MATYLLTWNPRRFDWDDLQKCIDGLKKKGFHSGDWSTGNSKSIRKGDRLFLIRLGKEPKGIVGSGWAESDVFENEHWEAGSYEAGKCARYVEVSFDKLLNPDEEAILPRSELKALGEMHWDSQASGVSIPADVARKLENLWADFLRRDRSAPIAFAEPSALEGVRTETVKYVHGRSRQLRELALNQANGICCVCEVDFRRVLNGQGVCVLQVHHRKQLAATDAPRITHLSELAVVCANCHLLIHMNPRQALSVEELRAMIRK